jgi:P2 family phage contractile tail tube protein
MSAKIIVKRITNANVYLDDESMLGKADEMTCPELVTKMTEHKALGMIGMIKLDTGFEEMKGKIKWNSIYDDIAERTVNPRRSYQLQVRGTVERHSAEGLIDEVPMAIFMTVKFNKTPFGMFKQHEAVEIETEFTCTAIKQVVDGKVIVEVDFYSNTFKAGGVDIMANYNANLGG